MINELSNRQKLNELPGQIATYRDRLFDPWVTGSPVAQITRDSETPQQYEALYISILFGTTTLLLTKSLILLINLGPVNNDQ